MNNSTNRYFFLKFIGLVIILMLLIPGTVLAEGEEPSAPAETPVVAEPLAEAAAEMPVVVEAPVLDAAIVEVPAETSASVAPSLEEAPLADLTAAAEAAGTELAGTDGAPLDMASQESANTLANSDPYFTVGATTYRFLAAVGGCSAYSGDICTDNLSDPIKSAIDYIQANGTIPTNRTIYVESGTYDDPVVIDGTQAYLNQIAGLVGINTDGTIPSITNKVYIYDTIRGFTLSGFTIAHNEAAPLVYFANNLGTLTLKDLDVENPGGAGITVFNHKGAVNVTNVKSSSNSGWGAEINNSTGGIFPVTITNSVFDHNNHGTVPAVYGLRVMSLSRVTLNGVTAQDNNGVGTLIESTRGATINNSVFNWNYSDPDTGENLGHGLVVMGDFTTNAISINNVQTFFNEYTGVNLTTRGAVTITNLDSVGNANGLDIVNNGSSVTISNSSLNYNHGHGLNVLAKQAITINSIEVNSNTVYGARLDNCLLDMPACTGSGFVKIAGPTPNYFLDNGDIGLRIYSGGAVTLTNFVASDNTQGGVVIQNNYPARSGIVTVNANYVPAAGSWINTLHDNGAAGLTITSHGAISVDKVYADHNGGRGIDLSNFNAATAKPVALKSSTAYLNTNDGIRISSLGAITLTNVHSFENIQMGANLNNGSGNAAVTVTSSAEVNFADNQTYGLFVVSNGAITLKNVNASGSRMGTYIDNFGSSTPKPVTITASDFSGAALSGGLYIVSNGAVTLKDVVSSNNAGYGIFVGDSTYGYVKSASLSGVAANNNLGGSGIEVYALGAVTLANIKASSNLEDGLYLDNCKMNTGSCEGSGNVTLSGTWNEFNDNGFFAVQVLSRGTITLSNFSASDNVMSGILLRNNYTNAAGSVKLFASNGQFNEVYRNGLHGMDIQSFGTISIARTKAEGNVSGTYISNSGAPSAKAIAISDSSFSYNQTYGLSVESDGMVTLKGVEAIGNSRFNTAINPGTTVRDRVLESPYMWEGGKFESWWFNSSGLINIQLQSTEFAPMVFLYDEAGHLLQYDENSASKDDAFITGYTLPGAGNYRIEVVSQDNGYGFYALSLDHDITDITYDYDNIYGVSIYNGDGTADVAITPSGSVGNNFSDNNNYGLYAWTKGNLSLNTVEASHNGYLGLWLVSNPDLVKNVAFTNVQVDDNQDSGVSLSAKGPVTWRGGGADGNTSYGAYLTNDGSLSAKPVTITNAAFNGNQGDSGLTIHAKGNITLTNVSASFNTNGSGYGAYLDNCHYTAGACAGTGAITITGKFGGSGFDGNGLDGLWMWTNSSSIFKMQNSSANDNGRHGMMLEKDTGTGKGPVTIAGTSSQMVTFNHNTGWGARVASLGPITLSYIEADINMVGLEITNHDALSPQTVTISKATLLDNNSDGLKVDSTGAVTLNNILAKGNVQSGLDLDNTYFPGQAVVINKSVFNDNDNFGLSVSSEGNITLNGVQAMNNIFDGAYLDTTPTGKVTILSTLGENVFNGNSQRGVHILSSGAVSLSKVTAEYNSDSGIWVDGAASLSIVSARVLFNQLEGIYATVTGNVTINNSVVSNNDPKWSGDYDGIWLDVTVPTSLVSITNSFVTANTGSGISLETGTSLTLTGTFYLGNDANGLNGDPNIEWR